MSDLPIHAVLPHLLSALRKGGNAVLVAPPGAGKTTAVAPALLAEPWCDGQILLLSPRRLAARAAAERIAELLGKPVGDLAGYATRMDSRQSAATRILVLTEGIFRNRIQDDPELSGVSALLFDEVHERSLDSDFGLALALDVQGGLRPDLRLVAMSATLDGARFSALMGDCPVVESEGRSHPLDLRHIGRRAELRIEDDMAAAIRRALAEEAEGDVLAFLPGVAEIERTAERLADLPGDIVVHRLHGSLEPREQRAAILRDREGRRKVILATTIAETSLTIDGVRIVVDSGLNRRARYDRAAGITRLVTEKASQAAATQRAGRAARQRPGVAYRLWEAAATQGLPPYDPPQILESDLSSLLLECGIWGVADPARLSWLDPPPAAALAEARGRLQALGALDADGSVNAHGRAVARLPLEPRIAHMLIAAKDMGLADQAARIAVLLGERGLGGISVDLEDRLRRWRQEKGARAAAGQKLARRWAVMVGGRDADALLPDHAAGRCLALAFPDRVAKRRSGDGADWISAGGRGFRLDPLSPLAREEWLAVGEVQGSASGARILSAAALDAGAVAELFADRITIERTVRFRAENGGVEALRQQRLGAIVLSSGGDDAPDPAMVAAALLSGVRQHGLDRLPWSKHALSLRRRAGFAQVEALSDAALLAELDDWLPPLLEGRRRLSDVDPQGLTAVLDLRLGWEGRKTLDRLAPEHFTTPMGTQAAIDYEAPGGPEVEIRVQALFGLKEHPCIGPDRLPLRLSLTSPARRPIQTTADLPGFWTGSWADVAKEMRGRYPRHPWPDNPADAAATLRTKRASSGAKS
ncbi:ATP-dependent helicase HrpB [Sphingobium jiangsuense]|uniref:ATP-dependent helicase HrpB n=2 Tax=Sphingobium jiangsuense TaxID=870476 RepID=A0A7W6BJ71_9SPHN|nr:ATP-dependent helicase HrpB [Sphingobium jiangsuense]MBB3927995.1 ATP-dependent helicase HrpB [Sphingobium jiangsuense]